MITNVKVIYEYENQSDAVMDKMIISFWEARGYKLAGEGVGFNKRDFQFKPNELQKFTDFVTKDKT